MHPILPTLPFIAALGIATTALADDPPTLPRYQVAGAGEKIVMVDSFTGRSWLLD